MAAISTKQTVFPETILWLLEPDPYIVSHQIHMRGHLTPLPQVGSYDCYCCNIIIITFLSNICVLIFFTIVCHWLICVIPRDKASVSSCQLLAQIFDNYVMFKSAWSFSQFMWFLSVVLICQNKSGIANRFSTFL